MILRWIQIISFIEIVTSTTSYIRVESCTDEIVNATDNPYSPLVPCSFLPNDLIECDAPIDLFGNTTAKEESGGFGCVKWGESPTTSLEHSSVECRALPCVQCHGSRTFVRDGHPCIRHTGHNFVTTLLYSIFLGWLAVDRFSLGYTAIGVGKMMTMGGVGVWWLIDVVLLVTGHLMPADGSSWEPYY